MLDIRYIRENAARVQEASEQKGYKHVDIAHLLQLDEERRTLLGKVEELRKERNDLSSSLKGQKPDEQQLTRGRELKTEIAEIDDRLKIVEDEFTTLLKCRTCRSTTCQLAQPKTKTSSLKQ
jgi:seryl-tRNA synthetase